ncbi:cation transporter [Hyphomicrobium sp.]|uniref:cation transporter n=1 Tax=Hyphomicrobium sp. TaxID=82 RepID=UPI003F7147C1
MAAGNTANVVIIAMSFNIALTFALFATAAWSGSSALLATAIQCLIGASSQAMVFYGLSHSARNSTSARHPSPRTAGTQANEISFWSFGVAVLLFSLGAGIAIYDGVAKLADPLPNKYVHIAYAALAAAFIAHAVTARLAVKQLTPAVPRTTGTARAAQEPAASTVAIESLAGLLGVMIAGAGIAISDWLSVPMADGYAAIAIGLLLGVVAAFMSLEIRNLLIGGTHVETRLGLSADTESPFFIEDAPTGDPSRGANSVATSSARSAPSTQAPSRPTSGPASDPGRPLSRKERKRHKGKR